MPPNPLDEVKVEPEPEPEAKDPLKVSLDFFFLGYSNFDFNRIMILGYLWVRMGVVFFLFFFLFL